MCFRVFVTRKLILNAKSKEKMRKKNLVNIPFDVSARTWSSIKEKMSETDNNQRIWNVELCRNHYKNMTTFKLVCLCVCPLCSLDVQTDKFPRYSHAVCLCRFWIGTIFSSCSMLFILSQQHTTLFMLVPPFAYRVNRKPYEKPINTHVYKNRNYHTNVAKKNEAK